MTTRSPDPALKLILGSGSPRRLELLSQIGAVPAAVRPPDIDESAAGGELPRDYVKRIAREKAAAIQGGVDEVILCADTTVALGRRILGKPADRAEAARFLYALSGRRHKVITAVVVRRGDDVWAKDVQTTVAFKRLTDREVNAYLASDDWQGKAGGYAIQGLGGQFVKHIKGSYSAIVGLPLYETCEMLRTMDASKYER